MSFHVQLEEFVIYYFLLFLTFLVTFRYEGKMWVAKNAKQPAPKPVEMSISSDKLVKGGATSEVPKKTRRHSLEEAVLSKHLGHSAPSVARSRGVNFVSY